MRTRLPLSITAACVTLLALPASQAGAQGLRLGATDYLRTQPGAVEQVQHGPGGPRWGGGPGGPGWGRGPGGPGGPGWGRGPGWGGGPGWGPGPRPGWGGPGWGRPGWVAPPPRWGGGWAVGPAWGPGWGGGWGPGWGWGPALGFGTGVIVGSAIASSPPPSRDWVAYCSARFRSYDPRTGTYLGYDGRRHRCP